jgi:hypothetical protein
MPDPPRDDPPFATVTMAQILLGQDMVEEATRIIAQLLEDHRDDPRTAALLARLKERAGRPEPEQVAMTGRGIDSMTLVSGSGVLRAEWELTEDGLGIARRRVRYSGQAIVRLFTAAPGPRGVRTATRDIEIGPGAAALDLAGLPRPAVHVAAVGFLGRNGAFVPLSRSMPVTSEP